VIHRACVDVLSRDRPAGLMASPIVPWPGPVPAPSTSNVVMAPSEAGGFLDSYLLARSVFLCLRTKLL
jgi:hypothetical protein